MNQDVGEVRVLCRDTSTFRFEWRIPDFSELQQGCYCSSPTVNYLHIVWHLVIEKDSHGIYLISLRRNQSTPQVPESFRFHIGWKTADGGEGDVARDHKFPRSFRSCYLDFIRPCITISSGGLILTCTLCKGDLSREQGVSRETQTEDPGFKAVSRETQTEVVHDRNDGHHLRDIFILSEQFKKLLLSGTGHDVLIKVKDKQFKAHKCVIQARSPVFAAMFSNEMVESSDSSVTIEDCDPDGFGEFLQFVYSGEVDISSPSSAVGLYYAGDKYDIPRLKELSVEFLKNSFTTTTVFDVVSLAARHEEEELLQQAVVYFAKNLEEVLITVEWQRFLLANPIQANEIYLKAAKCLKTSL